MCVGFLKIQESVNGGVSFFLGKCLFSPRFFKQIDVPLLLANVGFRTFIDTFQQNMCKIKFSKNDIIKADNSRQDSVNINPDPVPNSDGSGGLSSANALPLHLKECFCWRYPVL